MEKLTFETALKKLEVLIKELESGEIDLEFSIKKYKEANELINFCNKELQKATTTINKLMTDSGELKDFKVEE